jgi:hypothetical protein
MRPPTCSVMKTRTPSSELSMNGKASHPPTGAKTTDGGIQPAKQFSPPSLTLQFQLHLDDPILTMQFRFARECILVNDEFDNNSTCSVLCFESYLVAGDLAIPDLLLSIIGWPQRSLQCVALLLERHGNGAASDLTAAVDEF